MKGIIFDMDGVLVDSMKYHVFSWKKAFDEFQIKTSTDELFLYEGMSFNETIARISKENGVYLNKELQKKIYEKKQESLKNCFNLNFYGEIFEILDYLKNHGFKLAVVTGANKIFANDIISKNFQGYFDVVVTGDDVVCGKPNPEPYEVATKKLKLDEDEILVVENAPFGIESAKKAGLCVVALKTTLPEKHLMGADVILENHKDLLDYFKGIVLN